MSSPNSSSSSYNPSEDLWYQYFKGDSAQSNLLLAVYGFRSIWASLGILSNVAIVYITLVHKSLHGICNILIALESFFAIVQDASYFVSFIIYASGIKFITYQVCFPILIGMATCGNVAQMTMVLTGADRLLSILFPIWYNVRNKRNYLTFVGIILGHYAIYQFIIYFIDFFQSDAILMSCSTHELGQGRLGTVMYFNGIVLSAILMTFYTLIGIFAFLVRPIAQKVNEKNKRLIKPLIFIIAMNLIGVFIKCSMSVVFANFWKASVFIKMPFAIGMSHLTIAVYSANAPVLYLGSKEYRTKFYGQYKWLPKLFTKSSAALVTAPPRVTVASTRAFHGATKTLRRKVNSNIQ